VAESKKGNLGIATVTQEWTHRGEPACIRKGKGRVFFVQPGEAFCRGMRGNIRQ